LKCRNILKLAFDSGITHFDLATIMGRLPVPLKALLVKFSKITSKFTAMSLLSPRKQDGECGRAIRRLGSKKYLVSSLDQSLNRMGLDYVDIFYHTARPETPLEETMGPLT